MENELEHYSLLHLQLGDLSLQEDEKQLDYCLKSNMRRPRKKVGYATLSIIEYIYNIRQGSKRWSVGFQSE